MSGLQSKNEEDAIAFVKHYSKIQQMQIGSTWVTEDIRGEGRQGQEEKEASYFGICMGIVRRCFKKTVKDGKETNVHYFERVNGKTCPLLDTEGLLTKYCKRCEKNYDYKDQFCNTCVYLGGKNKGNPRELIFRKGSKNICGEKYKDFVNAND